MIPEESVTEAVLAAVRNQGDVVADMEKLLLAAEEAPARETNVQDYDRQIERLQELIRRSERFKMKLFESLQDGTLNRQEYDHFRENYNRQIRENEEAIKAVEKERELMINRNIRDHTWMEEFKRQRNVTALNRTVVVQIIDKILVTQEKEIEVHFRFGDQMEMYERFLEEYLEGKGGEQFGKEEQKRIG